MSVNDGISIDPWLRVLSTVYTLYEPFDDPKYVKKKDIKRQKILSLLSLGSRFFVLFAKCL